MNTSLSHTRPGIAPPRQQPHAAHVFDAALRQLARAVPNGELLDAEEVVAAAVETISALRQRAVTADKELSRLRHLVYGTLAPYHWDGVNLPLHVLLDRSSAIIRNAQAAEHNVVSQETT
jgi:hypothetical protein